MLIDTHVHLQSKAYGNDLDAVLKRAAEAGLEACIVAGTNLQDSQTAITLAEKYASTPCAIYAAVGIHPTSMDVLSLSTITEIRTLAKHPRVVAIGEIGLDYYWPHVQGRDWPCPEPPQQRAALQAQLEIASECNLPVIIHDREAHDDTLKILTTWIKQHPGSTGTLHAYAGGTTRLKEAIKLGFMIGIDGPITFPKAVELRKVAKQVPLNHLLLETDGPYLTPIPHRGKRNEPSYLIHIAEAVAASREISIEEVTQVTTKNARCLFPRLSTEAPHRL